MAHQTICAHENKQQNSQRYRSVACEKKIVINNKQQIYRAF